MVAACGEDHSLAPCRPQTVDQSSRPRDHSRSGLRRTTPPRTGRAQEISSSTISDHVRRRSTAIDLRRIDGPYTEERLTVLRSIPPLIRLTAPPPTDALSVCQHNADVSEKTVPGSAPSTVRRWRTYPPMVYVSEVAVVHPRHVALIAIERPRGSAASAEQTQFVQRRSAAAAGSGREASPER